MPEVLTMGETMAVFVPETSGPLRYRVKYDLKSAGAESNVAVGLSKLGHPAAYISRVGTDEMGSYIRNALRAEGVDITYVKQDPLHRTGIMLKEMMGGETRVFYYRENSAASHIVPEDITDEMFKGVKIVHMTGVTPVLSSDCMETFEKIFSLAEEKNIQISFDPNIRKKLWADTDFSAYIQSCVFRAQIVLLGMDEAEYLFGTNREAEIFNSIFKKGKADLIAIKKGGQGAVVSDGNMTFSIPPFLCDPIESIGAGDGFDAGFLSGILENKNLEMCGKMGAVCGAMATETSGDFEGYPDRERLDKILLREEIIYR